MTHKFFSSFPFQILFCILISFFFPSFSLYSHPLSSDPTTLSLSVDFNKHVVRSDVKNDVLKALVHFKGFSKISGENITEPVASVIVIDRSGSMSSENKLSFAVKGAHSMVDLLTENDTIGLVVFDDTVQTLFEMDFATEVNKAELHSIISNVRSGSATNIYDGLKRGIDMLLAPPSPAEKGRKPKTKRLILLSDGMANVNTHYSCNDLVAAAHLEAITITTVGLGLDYDEKLMQAIAEAGGGNYHYVRESESLLNVFVAELGYGRQTITRNTRAFLAYDTGAVHSIDIVGYPSRPALPAEIEHVRLLQGKKKRAGTETDSADGETVVAVDMREFVVNEEREMLLRVNYSVPAPSLESGAAHKSLQPYILPLASVVVIYKTEIQTEQGQGQGLEKVSGKVREEDRTHKDKGQQPAHTDTVTEEENIGTVRLTLTVDDDEQRADVANSGITAVEEQRRVGLAVEEEEANRAHLEAMDLMNRGDFDGAIAHASATAARLTATRTRMEREGADAASVLRVARQERRFEKTVPMVEKARKDRRLRERMNKASHHHFFAAAGGDGARLLNSAGTSSNYDGDVDPGAIEL